MKLFKMNHSLFSFSIILILLIILNLKNVSAQVGISETTFTANASSILELRSTTKGFLMPRMTKTQRDAIVSPATGLLIYQTDNTPGYYKFDGLIWSDLSSASSYTGVLPVLNGGTGQSTFTNGQLLIGNSTGNTLSKATLTAGNGISIINGAGSITISKNTFSGSDVSLTTKSPTDITGLSFSVAANTTYHFRASVIYTSLSAGEGVSFTFNGPASPSRFAYTYVQPKSNAGDAWRGGGNTYDLDTKINTSMLGDNVVIIEGVITAGATAGTLILRAIASLENKITVLGTISTMEVWK